jgi:hypothetical protein
LAGQRQKTHDSATAAQAPYELAPCKVMLPELLKVSLATFLTIWIPMLLVVLFAVDRFTVR